MHLPSIRGMLPVTGARHMYIYIKSIACDGLHVYPLAIMTSFVMRDISTIYRM